MEIDLDQINIENWKIEYCLPEEMQELGQPSEKGKWALLDDTNLVMGFFDTEEEAKIELEDWRQRDLVEDAFREWVTKAAEEIGIEREKVVKFVSEAI